MSQSDFILALAERQRSLRAADVRGHGCSPQLLLKLYQAGKLQRLARGVYGLPHASPSPHQTLMTVCQRVPKAVVCLLSALRFHEMGSRVPQQVWIGLPEGTQTPMVNDHALRIVRLRGVAYSEGIETVMEQGVPIRVYSAAKTVTDCFKFRNKIGLDVVLEALKDALLGGKVSADELTYFAKINRVERVMQPYIDAVKR